MKRNNFAFALLVTLATNLSAQTFTTLHSFTGGDGANPVASLTLSGNTLYGTTKSGGKFGTGSLFKVNIDGTGFTNLYSFTASTNSSGYNGDGATPYAELTLSGNTLFGTAWQGGTSADGVVFKINTDGTGFTVLHSFNSSDGANPQSGLILSGNTLYGTAGNGGISADGAVFEVNTDGTGFTLLHSFVGNPSDGANSVAGLILSGSTLYGTTANGGTNVSGTVFAINTNGSGFMILCNSNINDGRGLLSPTPGLIISGNILYGTTLGGYGTVFAINTDGSGFRYLHGFTTPNSTNSDGTEPFAGLILSGNTLFGTACSGGSSADGVVFKINTDGTGFTNLHNFTGVNDGANPYAGLILSGNTLYGTTFAGGSGGNGTVFALSLGPSAPIITVQPQSQSLQAGSNVTFTVAAAGSTTLNYQWQFNGQNIPNATNATLTLNSVTAANDGGYSVVVSNPYGSVTSATASLAVLTDGANGNKPTQITVPPIPPKPSNKDSLVVITHGWEPLQPNADLSWMTAMSNAIQSRVASNWAITNFVWLDKATDIDPDLVLCWGEIKGLLYGQQLASQGWSHIHFIGHSAGAALIENAAKQIPLNTTVQCTFLDPYVGLANQLQTIYGQSANWADCYFTQDVSGGWTGGDLPHAYNVDVDWLDPNHETFIYVSSLIAFSPELNSESHGYSHEYYTQSVTNNPSWCSDAAGYGFALSQEVGGQTKWSIHPTGNNNNPYVLCGPPNAIPSPPFPVAIAGITIDQSFHAVSDTVSAVVNGAGVLLNSIWSVIPHVQSGGIQPMDQSSTNTPAWLAVGVGVTNAVNFVQFNAAFTDTNSAQGLLTVYWNTNQIGMVDERVAATNSQTYRFELPGTVSGGLYTLSFRLDSFASSSSVAVTNVATGFVGVTQPITLGISLTNGAPLLQLTAATNYTYLIQSSTDLVNWTPTALLLNTNGSVQFMDSAVTNSRARFYRAVMP